MAFVEKNKSKPFFLYYAPPVPHKPLAAGEAFYKRSGNGLYADAIAELDWSVGQILDKLRELDLEKNTLVIFTSDNGPWYGGSAGPFRGMKGQTTEAGIRVPFIARLPSLIPAGKTSSESAIIMDVFPTVFKLCGGAGSVETTLDGLDLLPMLKSESKSPHAAIFFFRGEQLCAVRSGKWKLHVCPNPNLPRRLNADEKWIDPRARRRDDPCAIRAVAPQRVSRTPHRRHLE